MSVQHLKCIGTLEPHLEYLICLAIHPDGNFLVSSCYEAIKLWDLKDGTLVCSHKHYKADVGFSLIVSPDWRQFITDYDDHIEIRDIVTGERNFDFYVDSSMTMVSSLDGMLLVTAEHTNLGSRHAKERQFDELGKLIPIKVWNLATGKLIHTLQGHHNYGASSLIISRDGNTLLSHSHLNSTKLWNLRTGQEISTFSLLPSGYRYWIDSFAVTSTGDMVATGCKFTSNDGDKEHVDFDDVESSDRSNSAFFPKDLSQSLYTSSLGAWKHNDP